MAIHTERRVEPEQGGELLGFEPVGVGHGREVRAQRLDCRRAMSTGREADRQWRLRVCFGRGEDCCDCRECDMRELAATAKR